ncbi:plasmid pRiA4b ORF-3 family protein [bacterium]|nr:MAG: plasmid pRiA4b ORF-3 family protein [bacterium]
MVYPRGSAAGSIFHLKITLLGIEPAIWRLMAVRGDTALPRLHRILQAAMGWEDYHLHLFRVGREHFGVPDPDFDDNTVDERGKRLRDLASYGDAFIYEYDFGDGWRHLVEVDGVLDQNENELLPRCIEGERTCPPEDVGGIGGYKEFLRVIRDPSEEEHERMLEWAGGRFDPEGFDLEEAEARMRRLRPRRAPKRDAAKAP